jgi:hypothetical protein
LQKGRRHHEGQFRAFPVPNAVIVGRQHAETIGARRKERIGGAPRCASLPPILVHTDKLVAELDLGRIRKAEAGILRSYPLRSRRQLQAIYRIERTTVGKNPQNLYRWRHAIGRRHQRIEHRNAAQRRHPDPAGRIRLETGLVPVDRRPWHTVRNPIDLDVELGIASIERTLKRGCRNAGDTSEGMNPGFARWGLCDPRYADEKGEPLAGKHLKPMAIISHQAFVAADENIAGRRINDFGKADRHFLLRPEPLEFLAVRTIDAAPVGVEQDATAFICRQRGDVAHILVVSTRHGLGIGAGQYLDHFSVVHPQPPQTVLNAIRPYQPRERVGAGNGERPLRWASVKAYASAVVWQPDTAIPTAAGRIGEWNIGGLFSRNATLIDFIEIPSLPNPNIIATISNNQTIKINRFIAAQLRRLNKSCSPVPMKAVTGPKPNIVFAID